LADAIGELDDYGRPRIEVARHAHRRQSLDLVSGSTERSRCRATDGVLSQACDLSVKRTTSRHWRHGSHRHIARDATDEKEPLFPACQSRLGEYSRSSEASPPIWRRGAAQVIRSCKSFGMTLPTVRCGGEL
jgi:hypothetical protein